MKIFVGAGNRKAMDPEKLRVPVPDTLEVIIEDFVGFIKKYASNISKGGVFVATERPIDSTGQLRILFRLEDDYTLIRALGTVVWIREKEEAPQRPAGMGIRFDWLDEESQRLIDKIVSNYIKEGGKPFKLEDRAPAGTVLPPPAAPLESPEDAFPESGEVEGMKDEAAMALEKALGEASEGDVPSPDEGGIDGIQAGASLAPGLDRDERGVEPDDARQAAAFVGTVAKSLAGSAPTEPPSSPAGAAESPPGPAGSEPPAPEPPAPGKPAPEPPPTEPALPETPSLETVIGDSPSPISLDPPELSTESPFELSTGGPSLPDYPLEDDEIEPNFDVIEPKPKEPAEESPADGEGLLADGLAGSELGIDAPDDLGLDLDAAEGLSLDATDATDASDEDFASRLDSALDDALPDRGAGPMFEMAESPEWPPSEDAEKSRGRGPEMPPDSVLGGAELDEMLNAPLPSAGAAGASEPRSTSEIDELLDELDDMPPATTSAPPPLSLDPPDSAFDFGESGADVDLDEDASMAPPAPEPSSAAPSAPLSDVLLSTGSFEATSADDATDSAGGKSAVLSTVFTALRAVLFIGLFVGLGIAGYVVVQRYLARANDDGFPAEGLTTEEVDSIGGTQARTLLAIMQGEGEGDPEVTELTDRPLGNLTRVQNITWEQREDATVVVLWADGRFTPTTTSYARLGEDPPREVVRVLGVEAPYSENEIPMEESPFVQYLRIGYHQGRFDELHIIAELVEPDVRLKRFELDGPELRLFFSP